MDAHEAFARCEGNEWQFPEDGVAATIVGFDRLVAVVAPELADDQWHVSVNEQDSSSVELAGLLDMLPVALHPWVASQLDRMAEQILRDAVEMLWAEAEDEFEQAFAGMAAKLRDLHRSMFELERRYPELRADKFNPAGAVDRIGRRDQLTRFANEQLGRELTADERLNCAALALTKSLYRNSPLEDAHADPDTPLYDEDMFRGNVATYRAIRALLDQPSPWRPIARLLVDSARVMPDGRAFGDWIGREQGVFDRSIGEWLAFAEERSARDGDDSLLDQLALGGLIGCADWYGHPRWPARLDRFAEVLAAGEWHGRPLPPRSDGISDRQLLGTLRHDPSQLTAEQAEWCLAAALGFV